MTAIEIHIKKIKEHLGEIKDAIDEGIENKPITIGFHCSACAIELLEVYLHKINKIPLSKVLKHNWFKSPKIEQKKEALAQRKVGVQFQNQEEIYALIYEIEDLRDNLVYGNSNPVQIHRVINSFLKLKLILIDKIKEEGLDLEKE